MGALLGRICVNFGASVEGFGVFSSKTVFKARQKRKK